MATTKKYAGLPDVDEDGVEIYETAAPDLTEESTLPTESDVASEDENSNLDRNVLDPDAARQRFEPAMVNARHANFSDTVDGGRRDYRTRSRRRRRRAALVSGKEDQYYSDDSEEETLQGRLARLRREAAELQAEIDQIEDARDKHTDEDDDSDYEDTVDHQAHHNDLSRGADELGKSLQAMSLVSRKKGQTLEEQFIQKLEPESTPSNRKPKDVTDSEAQPQPPISAIADFSDRLTALETALGVSSLSSTTSPASILSTLSTLTTQVETLYSTLSPRPDPGNLYSSASTTSTVHLDPLAQKIRHLISESKRLEDSRRAAAKSFEELLESRDRHAHLIPHSHSNTHPNTEARLSRTLSGSGQETPNTTNGNTPTIMTKSDLPSTFTTLFLDSQSSRISALYALLPTLQSLQPLLPVVLERLRALSVLHTGAGEVRGELDEVESRLEVQEGEVAKWREAVEGAEQAMREGKDVLKENVQVVSGLVRSLEGQIARLDDKGIS